MNVGDEVIVKGKRGRIVLARDGSERVKVQWDAGGASLLLRKHVRVVESRPHRVHDLVTEPSYERPLGVAQPKRPPLRSDAYLRFVRLRPCVGCGTTAQPREAHHTRTGGMGLKGDDWRAVALCRGCHDAEHWGRGPEDHTLLEAQIDSLIDYLDSVGE